MKVKVKDGPHKVPLVEPNATEDKTTAIEGWSDDDDFKTDVLSSARKATIANSGSGRTQKQGRSSVQQRKIRRLVYSSEEDESTEGEEEEGEREGDTRTQKVPSRFTFSDDDN